jgi:hypothetical protein
MPANYVSNARGGFNAGSPASSRVSKQAGQKHAAACSGMDLSGRFAHQQSGPGVH